VGATETLTERDDGLSQPWRGRVYCNPPGANSAKSVRRWWEHAQRQHYAALTWCLFNCEHARHLVPRVWDLPGYLVIPLKRVAFLRDGAPIKSPRNWTWFWTTRQPAPTPIESRIAQTGCGISARVM